MRNNQKTLLAVIHSAAHEAANFHEPYCKRVDGRQEVVFETAVTRVPSRYVGLLQGVARHFDRHVGQDPRDLAALFEPDAYERLCQLSASHFYFWRIIAFSADLAQNLPMKVSDIERGAAEFKHRCFIGSALGLRLMKSQLPDIRFITSAERTELYREGFVVAKGDFPFIAADHITMEVNPLFA